MVVVMVIVMVVVEMAELVNAVVIRIRNIAIISQ